MGKVKWDIRMVVIVAITLIGMVVLCFDGCAPAKSRACLLPMNTPSAEEGPTPPSAGIEWCRQHPEQNCCVVKGE